MLLRMNPFNKNSGIVGSSGNSVLELLYQSAFPNACTILCSH